MEIKELFSIDKKDYSSDAKVYSRPSARAVICVNEKVLVIHALKYDYYKFPGGGIEKDETPEEALIREVKEETGYDVLRETIEPLGKVIIKHKDDYDEKGVFIQENYYYFCKVKENRDNVCLDDYEAEEEFTVEWKEPFPLHFHNKGLRSIPKNENMIKREAKMFDIVDREMRKRKRLEDEKNLLASLERPDNEGKCDYGRMLSFVRDVLNVPTEDMANKSEINYSRFEHIKRVLGWMLRLYKEMPDKSGLRFTDLVIATIFHDVGRPAGDAQGISHALAGGPITREYLENLGYDRERIDYIVMLVEKHSDKYLMKEKDTDPNLILLMEADLLDDMGVQGIVMDCMITESRNSKAQFVDCLDHMTRYTRALQKNNPMVSEAGRRIWDEKTKLVDLFVDVFEKDCTISLDNTK